MDDGPAPAIAPAPPGTIRERRWSPLLLLIALVAASLFLAAGPIRGECGFRAITGADCPGCGMTRATLALARGDAAGAWRWHPAVFPLVALAAAALALGLHEGITGRRSLRGAAERYGIRAGIALAVLLGVVWAVR
ncbi:MAG TPA: DUF2752 domain-containing protein, partial [Planctomycetota bacterium]|nr:DUF2752 domain-containing protein [Planctomycetota bacterium]